MKNRKFTNQYTSKFSRVLTFLGYNIIVWIMMSSCSSAPGFGPIHENNQPVKEIVLFCGNPGAGKSTLLNSLLQGNKFASGVSVGQGMTKFQQDFILNGVKYVDTPGLADAKIRDQAAKSIEEALKQNGNYKIAFVITVEAGRIRPDDLQTINAICGAIKTEFSYGIILNKVTKPALKKLEAETGSLEQIYASNLTKQPDSYTVILKDENLEDEDNVYLAPDSEQFQALEQFVGQLKPNKISAQDVVAVPVDKYEQQVKLMQEMIEKNMKEMQAMRESHERQMENLNYELRKSYESQLSMANQNAQNAREYAEREKERADRESRKCLIQ